MADITRRTERSPGWRRDWFPRRVLELFDAPEGFFSGEGAMHVEQFREGGALVVRAEVPGVDPDKDVEITVHDGLLEIRAERREETTAEGKEHYRSEFRYGMFSRSVPLPAGASESDIAASYRDGVLEVRVPVAEAAPESRKKIPISRS